MNQRIVWLSSLTALFEYMWKNKWIRQCIRAPINQTLLYCGQLDTREQPMAVWKYIDSLRADRKAGLVPRFVTLPETLKRVPLPAWNQSLMGYIQMVEREARQDARSVALWKDNEPRLWKLLSAIFASNAEGKVYFMVGSGLNHKTTVFANTEIHALAGNTQIDAATKAEVRTLMRCIQSREVDINHFSFPHRKP